MCELALNLFSPFYTVWGPMKSLLRADLMFQSTKPAKPPGGPALMIPDSVKLAVNANPHRKAWSPRVLAKTGGSQV